MRCLAVIILLHVLPLDHAQIVQVAVDQGSHSDLMNALQTRANVTSESRPGSQPQPLDFYWNNLPAGHSYGFGNGQRSFIGADPTATGDVCLEDKYTPSEMEAQWYANAGTWLEQEWHDDMKLAGYVPEHCKHLSQTTASAWIQQNEHGNHDPAIFSRVCRKGKVPEYIEPLAGILRDPRFPCDASFSAHGMPWYSLDWIVYANKKAVTPGTKARFYDAGGSQFIDALQLFLEIYKGQGVVFDEVYVWEYRKQGTEVYWDGVEPALRKFWEPRLTFYDGVGVTDDKDSDNNPTSRIFRDCKPEDFCAFKLDVDTPPLESALAKQLLATPAETKAKLDEFYFEQHVHGYMQKFWGDHTDSVNGKMMASTTDTFVDSYKLFTDLRNLGVRAHSWV